MVLDAFDALVRMAGWLLIAPAVVLFAQVLAAGVPARLGLDANLSAGTVRPRVAVLVPAHDEEGGITATLLSVRGQLSPGDRLVVVADNCSDDTARVARDAGAEVVERNDSQLRGKGYALNCGVRFLEAAPPDVVVVVDADCLLGEECLPQLVSQAARTGRPAQALYLMSSPPEADVVQRIAEFAWIMRNRVRPLGMHRLGMPCQLMGTGMAIPWPLMAGASLATGEIVEDMQLGLDLAALGNAPIFCPVAAVTSLFPTGKAAIAAQRTRWEHGHLWMIAKRSLPLLARAVAHGQPMLAAMVLDLCVPPLASLVIVQLIVTGGATVLLMLGGDAGALKLVLLGLMLTTSAVFLARRQFAPRVVTCLDLLAVPRYLGGKLPVYLRLLGARQTSWIRTRRDDVSK